MMCIVGQKHTTYRVSEAMGVDASGCVKENDCDCGSAKEDCWVSFKLNAGGGDSPRLLLENSPAPLQNQ